MELKEYCEKALRTAALGSDTEILLAGALGLAGEAGEVADAVKKHFFQGHDLSGDKILEELGDLIWYANLLAYRFGHSLEDVLSRNIAKLERRYPTGRFRVEDSTNRTE